MMNKVFVIMTTLFLVACQTPSPYNGITGYEIEDQTQNTATIRYTMAKNAKQDINEARLQRICQQVLANKQQYRLNVLSQQEISAPKYPTTSKNLQVGESRLQIGFSDSPDLRNSQGYAGRQIDESRPNSLMVIRYQCL